MAAKAFPAMTQITTSHIIKGTLEKGEAPEGYLPSPARAIGRVLALPVVEGQVLTKSCLVPEGSAAQLASALPHGMRAFTVTISTESVMGILYPGCVVDVLATFKLSQSKTSKGQAISTTLIPGVQVLAVENISIVSKEEEREKSALAGVRSGSRRLTVTLMVNPKQAEALQLAVSNGSISLAMRNPLDKRPVDEEPTVLSEVLLAKLASLLGPKVLAESEKAALLGEANEGIELSQEYQTKPSSHRVVTLIRGREVLDVEVDISESEATTGAGAEE
jgi:Flp pilus assembly protein CpaB